MEKKKTKKSIEIIIISFFVIIVLSLFYYASKKFILIRYQGMAMSPFFKSGQTYWFFKKDIHKIQRGDVVAYWFDDSSICISRVIAIGGDTVELRKNKLLKPYIQKNLMLKNNYILYAPKINKIKKYLMKNNVLFYEIINDSLYVINADSAFTEQLKNELKGVTLEVKLMEENEPDYELWYPLREKGYNRENFTYYVPIDSNQNFRYFFLLNDNRSQALDSRFFGPIEGKKIMAVYAGL